MRSRLRMHGHGVGAGFGEIVQEEIDRRNHQMNVEGPIRMRPQRLHHRRPDRDVGHEMPVHDVDMQIVGTRRRDRARLLAEPGGGGHGMVVMFTLTDPVEREHAMANGKATPARLDWKAVLTSDDEDGFRALLQTVVQEVLEAEMTETLQAEKNERTTNRLGHRSGYYDRKLVTRVGVLELRVPQDRTGRFSTELFERYQRSANALVAPLAERYVQGVSTRKVKAITEELCGHSCSASAISDATARLDGMLTAFAERRLGEAYPYLILDARYERIREAGAIQSQAVLIAIGVDWEDRRQGLGVELANRDTRSSRRDFLAGLKGRGLYGVEFVVSPNT